jgi:hypothetical protein
VTVGKAASPEDAVPVDLDGDRSLDVVSCCEGKTQSVFVHWAPKERRRQLDPQAMCSPAKRATTSWFLSAPQKLFVLVMGADPEPYYGFPVHDPQCAVVISHPC